MVIIIILITITHFKLFSKDMLFVKHTKMCSHKKTNILQYQPKSFAKKISFDFALTPKEPTSSSLLSGNSPLTKSVRCLPVHPLPACVPGARRAGDHSNCST